MKKLSQALALVAVTTLFATAFTTSQFDKQIPTVQVSSATSAVAQVVIIGKRMTAVEKANYDAEALAQSATRPDETRQPAFRIAVK